MFYSVRAGISGANDETGVTVETESMMPTLFMAVAAASHCRPRIQFSSDLGHFAEFTASEKQPIVQGLAEVP